MMRFLPTVRSTLVPRRVFVMGPNAACFIATQANHPRSLMPTEARLPNLLALLPKKPGGEINPHFKETETAFNTWVEKKLGRRYAMVCACVYRSILFSHPLYQDVYESDCPRLLAMTYPLVSSLQLRQLLDFSAAAVMLDDILYEFFHRSFNMGSGNLHSERSPSENVEAFSQMWMNTLLDGNNVKTVQRSPMEMMLGLVDPFALSLLGFVEAFLMQ